MRAEVSMVDLVIHIDETLDEVRRRSLLTTVREAKGIIAVGYHNETPNLMIVVFDPKDIASADVLNLVKSAGVHAEFTGG